MVQFQKNETTLVPHKRSFTQLLQLHIAWTKKRTLFSNVVLSRCDRKYQLLSRTRRSLSYHAVIIIVIIVVVVSIVMDNTPYPRQRYHLLPFSTNTITNLFWLSLNHHKPSQMGLLQTAAASTLISALVSFCDSKAWCDGQRRILRGRHWRTMTRSTTRQPTPKSDCSATGPAGPGTVSNVYKDP